MKIIQLTAENVKRIKAVQIKPTDNVVTIAGKNGQGKTSILDAIMWVFAGTSSVQGRPLRDGENKGRINAVLGDGDVVELIAERRFTPTNGKGEIWVESADGARHRSPQQLLDGLIGALSFDPTAFIRKKPADQLNELKQLVKLDVDVEKLDQQNVGDYQRRTDLNRDAKAKRAQMLAMLVPADTPAEPVDEAALLEAITTAGDENAKLEQRKARREAVAAQAVVLRAQAAERIAEVEHLRQRMATLQTEALQLENSAKDLDTQLAAAPALPAPTDLQAMQASLKAAQAANRHVEAAKKRAALAQEATDLEAQAAKLTETMEARTAAKEAAIKGAKMPIDGLTFGDGMVLYRGVPLEQASDAQQIQVSMAIAMASNPKLRVIRIRDGSLLDDDSMAELTRIATENDFQVWVERVDSTGKVGIVIEDGTVASTPESRAKD